jgi:hypothetical protein
MHSQLFELHRKPTIRQSFIFQPNKIKSEEKTFFMRVLLQCFLPTN